MTKLRLTPAQARSLLGTGLSADRGLRRVLAAAVDQEGRVRAVKRVREPDDPAAVLARAQRRAEDKAGDLAYQLTAAGITGWVREHRFHAPRRQWRIDIAWPRERLGVEVDGGIWIDGRHTSGSGIEEDSLKVSTAVANGWRMMRFTPRMIRDGVAVDLIRLALANLELDL